MKKKYILLECLKFSVIIAFISTATAFSLTDSQIQKETQSILGNLVSGHTAAFGNNNFYKGPFDLNMWHNAISRIKTLATNVINENKNFLGMRDSTLTKALEKITESEMQLINTVKVTRAVLTSASDLQKQVNELNKIKNDMLAVQKTLSSSMSPVAKDEIRKLLNSTAMFIEQTANRAAKEAVK